MPNLHEGLSCPSSLPNGSVCIAGEVLPNLLDLMPNGMAYCKMLYEEGKPPDFICLYSNPAFHRQIGLIPANGERLDKISSRIRKSHPDIFETLGRIAAGGAAESFEFFIKSLKKWVCVQLFSPKPEHFIAIFNDITESKRAAEALAESERRCRSILEDQTEIICRFKADGTILYINDAYCRLFGKSRESLVGNKWQPNAWEEDLPNIHEKLNSLSPANPVVVIENRIITRGGAIRWGQFINRGFFNENGRLIEMQSIGRDITEQKQAEESLAAQQRMLQSILDYTPAILFIKDLHERYLLTNRYNEKILGIRSAEICGKTAHEFLPKELADQFAENDRRVIASGQAQQVEETIPEADGPHVYASVQFPIFDAYGRPSAICGISTDITERKQAEAALRASERRFRAIFNQHFQYSALLSPEGIVLEITDSVARGTGVDSVLVIGRPLLDAPWWKDLPETQSVLHRQFEETLAHLGPSQSEVTYRAQDGSLRYAINTIKEVHGEQGEVEYLLVEGIDITDRKQAEMALRESRQQLALALKTGQLGFWDWDIASGWVQFSGRWAAMLGYDLSEVEPHVRSWEQLVHPDDKTTTMAVLSDHLEGRTDFYECEHRMRHKDGSWRWILSRGQVLERDARGRPLRAIGTHTDVTSRREAEEALRDADRRKDEFLATLAHELRNPLAPIRNGLQILRRSLDKATVESRTLDMMERQLLHMIRLIDDLFDLSRIGRGKIELHKEPVELAAVVKHAVETSRPFIAQRHHEFELLLPAESILVKADLVRLSQVFSNLLNNAAKYTPPGGRITLSITTQGRKVLVRVQDTGIGIPVSMQERVFDLFTQVDPSVEKSQGGLGIGLCLVKRLVELHGGTVEAHSKGCGQGSEFVVRLPVWQSACLQEQDTVIQKPVANSPAARRILIADDNADAAASLAMLLGMLGHEVYTVKDGQEAVEVAEKRRPELILLDLNMPRLNGYEACRRLRTDSWGRNTAIVALTGLGQDQDLQASRAAGFDHHIVKPVDLVELERLLETLPDAGVH